MYPFLTLSAMYYWACNLRDVLNCVHKHVKRLLSVPPLPFLLFCSCPMIFFSPSCCTFHRCQQSDFFPSLSFSLLFPFFSPVLFVLRFRSVYSVWYIPSPCYLSSFHFDLPLGNVSLSITLGTSILWIMTLAGLLRYRPVHNNPQIMQSCHTASHLPAQYNNTVPGSDDCVGSTCRHACTNIL